MKSGVGRVVQRNSHCGTSKVESVVDLEPPLYCTSLASSAIAQHNSIVHGCANDACQFDVFAPGSPISGISLLAGTGLLLTFVGSKLRSLSDRSQSIINRRHKRASVEEIAASKDSLTGLLNREGLLSVGKRTLSEFLATGSSDKRAGDGQLALITVDIDQFKDINLAFGCEGGDELLCELSERLRTVVRSLRTPMTLARIAGNEFAISIANIGQGELCRIGRRVLKELQEPFVIQKQPVTISCRIGAALANVEELRCFSTLVEKASLAMNANAYSGLFSGEERSVAEQSAGDARANRLVLFEPKIEETTRSRLSFERSLPQAIGHQQFEMHYQPIVDLQSAIPPDIQMRKEAQKGDTPIIGAFKTVGLEALIRWRHPEKGLLQPGQFLPIAQTLGLMFEIDRWVLEAVCRQLVQWRQTQLVINVNLSADHLMRADLVDYIERLLRYYPISPRQINLEITEGEFIADLDRAAHTLHKIKALGLSVSLDDFGCGYSSLTYLDRLPADVLKIDRSFIHRMSLENGESKMAESSRAIVKSVLELARELDIRVVAEGIERVDQLESLKEMRCAYGQGFLFSRPTTARLAERLLSP